MNSMQNNKSDATAKRPLRLLLIDANTSWLGHAGGKGAGQVVLPLGLMYLSAAVKQAMPHSVEVKLINTAVDCLGNEEFEAEVRGFAPDVVGFRALSVACDFFAELARTVRRIVPGATLIAGGPHATCHPQRVLAETPIDYVIAGEGERSLVELLEHLQGRRPIGAIGGLYYRRGQEVVLAAPPQFIDDLDSLPPPDYEVIDQAKYAAVLSYGYTIRKQGVVLSSRGCPFGCRYCFKSMGRRYRPRSVGSVVDEIESLQKTHGIRDIMFVDDTFNLQPRRVEGIFREIIARGLQCNYYFPAGLRADLMTPELVDLLVEAGTCWITYAVETVVPRVQQIAGRAGDPAKAAEIIDYTAARRIMVGLFFMVGFPTETRDEAMATLRYVRERRQATMPYFFAVKYFPGTELTRLAIELGAIDAGAERASCRAYHDVSQSRTSTLGPDDFQELFTYYLKEILLDGRRLRFALDVQQRFLSPEELAAAYGALLGRTISDPRRAFRHALAQTDHEPGSESDGPVLARAS